LFGAERVVFQEDGITGLVQQLLGAVPFDGLTPPVDKEDFRSIISLSSDLHSNQIAH